MFQVALSGFLSLIMLLNATLIHSPLFLSMQLPLVVTLFIDMYITYHSDSTDPFWTLCSSKTKPTSVSCSSWST